jgi:8-oxo-dGTP pyrophosphatase MutT (NUDIX family)
MEQKINDFDNFISFLKSELKKELPGLEAQKIMIPRIDIPVNKNIPITHASVLILLYSKNKKTYFVLIKRNEYEGIHSGQISLPGGKSEVSDTSIMQTALREAAEEIGPFVETPEIIGELTELTVRVSNFKVHTFIAYIKTEPVFKPDPFEVAAILECPLYDLADKNNLKETTKIFNNTSFIAPYFSLNNEIVWGATAMILSEFKQILLRLSTS